MTRTEDRSVPELAKRYVPADHEPRIREKWTAAGASHADPQRVLSGAAKPFSIVIPPPNVTGALHLGHALNNTLQDILTRFHRMSGFETLWMPGTDHAGIATQAVVERRLLKEQGKRRTDFTREQFVAQVQAWKDEYEARITDQLKTMGCSCDFERQRFTMDEVCAAAVREAFFRLFKDGLIYRGKRLVNWDPVLQTAVADDECYDAEIDGQFYFLRYPLVHRSGAPATWSELRSRGWPADLPEELLDGDPGARSDDRQAWVTVATTRPETYLGDTAVGVNPRDPRAPALRALAVRLPLVGRVIPIVEDGYVVLPKALATTEEEAGDPKAAFATGFLKVTPGHDANDYELGRRHNLPIVNVMAPDATISDRYGWSDVGDARRFVGLSREEARKRVVAEFKAHTVGGDAGAAPLFAAAKPYRHTVPHSDRSKAVIEPYLSDQWFCKVTDDRLRGAALRAMAPEQRTTRTAQDGPPREHDGRLRFFPARYARTFETWHENLRDWCISRQLWWGHRIPVWSRRLTPAHDADLLAAVTGGTGPDAIAGLLGLRSSPANACVRVFGGPDAAGPVESSGPSASAGRDVFVCLRDPDGADADAVRALEARGFRHDEDVLDTWFSSALWPLSTMGWPNPAAFPATAGLLEAYNPTTVLSTAREIITLWVSRMVMFNRYFRDGRLPFTDVFIHAVVQDGNGQRMSKSAGNGVDPLDIIRSHGSDAMRFVLAKMTTQTQDVRMPVQKDAETGLNTSPRFDEGRNFCTKLWNAARFALLNLTGPEAAGDAARTQAVNSAGLSLADRWMLSRVASAAISAERAIREYEFSVYAGVLYDVLWRDFCDWYLEAIKPTVKHSPDQRAVLRAVLDAILRILHPVAPFITETLWEEVSAVKTVPVRGLDLPPSATLARAAWPGAAASLRDEAAEADFERLRSVVEGVRAIRASRNIDSRRRPTLHADAAFLTLAKLAGGMVETMAGLGGIVATPPATAATPLTLDGREYLLTDLEDAADAAGASELLKQTLTKLDNDIAALEKRLSSPGYAQKAPAKLVQESQQQLAQKRAERDAARRRLEELTTR
ncbi:MAG: valine--tRNA ligase [Phycisphaerales bacterium]|nr:valine--tRNA ligase [Phycisphaerales bacterium]